MFFILCLGANIGSQEWISVRSRYYEILAPVDSIDAARVGRELDLRYEAYNKLFCFDPALRTGPTPTGSLKARLFTDKAGYDGYVSSKLGSTRDGAVYLHYNSPENRELVINRGNEERMLPHQSFIQFLRAFIPNPPSWIREGAAVYFNSLSFNREKAVLEYEENLAWLDTVKKLGKNIPGPEAILLADKNGMPQDFQAVSWALISFFLSDSAGYNRSLTDSFMVLSPSASAEVNSEAVYKRIILFNDMGDLGSSFVSYIASKKSFNELVESGQKAYTAKDYAGAAAYFKDAQELKKNSYIPGYFLGLLSYEQKAYDKAEDYYNTALKLGADRALIQYARGVNAAAAGKNADAIHYLQEASDAAPEKYKTRADDLIKRLK
jgi:hypothetical protein